MLIIIPILLLATGCMKETLFTGYLMQSCDVPAANKSGMLGMPGFGGGFTEFTTDENGYFEFKPEVRKFL